MRVLVLENPQAPLVTTALLYLVGARDEPAPNAGLSHFLEHMMFKGSPRYPVGEIDRVTQRLGGANNAMTWHDGTLYHFDLGAEHWREALAIEADRMTALTLDPDEVEGERRVILEEIAAYEDDPWHRLESRVEASFFGAHPYGRQVPGTAESVRAIGVEELAEWHQTSHRPDRALLTLAGAVDARALDVAEELFGSILGSPSERPVPPPRRALATPARERIEKGVLPRMILMLPCPEQHHADYVPLRAAAALLGIGRAGRLHRELVEQRRWATSVECTVLDSVDPGCFSVSVEVVPGIESGRVEDLVVERIAELGRRPARREELRRVARVMSADWCFDHETIAEQAITACCAEGLFGDLDFSARQLREIARLDPDRVVEAASRWLAPGPDAVVGWAVPERVVEGSA